MTGTHPKGLSYIGRGAVAALLLGSLAVAPAPAPRFCAGGWVDARYGRHNGRRGYRDLRNGDGDDPDHRHAECGGPAEGRRGAGGHEGGHWGARDAGAGHGRRLTHHTRFTPHAHFSNYRYAGLANLRFGPARPTSLLYAVVQGSPSLAGVMYTAPATDTPAQLAQILLSTIVSWHQHMGICYLARGVRTGVAQAACESQGGTWTARSQWYGACLDFPGESGRDVRDQEPGGVVAGSPRVGGVGVPLRGTPATADPCAGTPMAGAGRLWSGALRCRGRLWHVNPLRA